MRTLLSLLAVTTLATAAEPTVDPRLLATARTLFKDLTSETLPNGLKVVMLPIPGAKTVTTMVAYKVGAGDESKQMTGLSHYLEHLLFKGTDKLVPGDIDRATQKNGGHNNAYTNEDMTVYHFDFAADRWMIALDIEADRMRNCRIDDKHEFQQEKGAVISELKGGEDRPWDLEYKAILPRLFGKADPYSHPVIGEEQHVRAATAEIITRYYDQWYHPNNATLVIVGGFDPVTAMAKVKELFSSIPKAELPERVPTPKPNPRAKQVRHEFASKFDVPRAMIGFNGVAVGDPDDYVFDVLSQVLSGGRTSRLYRTLVEKEQLCAEVDASNSAGRYPGWFGVSMEMLAGKDRVKAEQLLFAELQALAGKPISDAELKRVRQNMVASYIFGRESGHSLCDQIARSATYKDLDYLTTYLDKALAVTPADIQRVAKKYLDEQAAVVVWSIPPEAKPAGKRGSSTVAPQRHGKADASTSGGGFDLAKTQRVVLKNGMKVLMLENHRLPIVVAMASVADGRLREPLEKAGVAALVGMTLEEGTAKHTGPEIAAIIEDVGGSLKLSANGGSVKVLTPDTDLGLGLLFECLAQPSFPADRLEAMREQLLGEIAANESEPRKRASEAFMKQVYGDHPYGRPSQGNAAVVEKLTAEDCKTFHQALFVPNNTTLVLVGDFDAATMVAKLEAMTADWKSGDLPKLAVVAPAIGEKTVEKIISDKTAAQTHVYIGHLGIRRNDPDYYQLEVMDNVLGVGPGFTDRLSSTLRDRQGLAYTVRASIAGSAGEQPGAFTGYIGTFPEKYTWVRDGFMKEINRLRDEPPTAAEVDAAKQYLLGSMPFRLETTGDAAAELLAIEKYGLGLDAFDKYRTAIAAVTPADVQAMAKKHLDPAKMIVVAVGPIGEDGQPLKTKDGGKKGDGR